MSRKLVERSHYEPTGYQMIRSVKIENFRGIKEVEIINAGRLNILVGPNGTGKTAFLEGVFLAGGTSPEIVLRTRQWRGREVGFAGTPEQVQEAIWADTFSDAEIGSAKVSLSGDDPIPRSVEIKKAATTKEVSSSGEEELTSAGMEFIYDGLDGHYRIVPKPLTNGKWEMGSAGAGLRAHFIPARVNVSESETARAFSQLKIEERADLFLNAFLKEFPIIEEVSTEAPSGPPALY